MVLFIILGTLCLGLACCPCMDAWARALCGTFSGLFLISILIVVVGREAVERAYRFTKSIVKPK
jgi:hypothetical protein